MEKTDATIDASVLDYTSVTLLVCAYLESKRAFECAELLTQLLKFMSRIPELIYPQLDITWHKVQLARAYSMLNRREEAQPLLQDVLQAQRDQLGNEHFDTLETMAKLGGNYMQTERRREGLRLLDDALKGMEKTLGKEDPETVKMRKTREIWRDLIRKGLL